MSSSMWLVFFALAAAWCLAEHPAPVEEDGYLGMVGEDLYVSAPSGGNVHIVAQPDETHQGYLHGRIYLNGVDLLKEREERLVRDVSLRGDTSLCECDPLAELPAEPLRLPTAARWRYCKDVCESQLDGGGWTLIGVVSDDGQERWLPTMWFADTTTFGSLLFLQHNFKSPALHTMPMTDVLFEHLPSGVWVSYHNISDGTRSLSETIADIDPACYEQRNSGFAPAAGSLLDIQVNNFTAASVTLCDHHLYFSPLDKSEVYDWKGPRPAYCELHVPVQDRGEPATGPTWNRGTTSTCHSKPERASLFGDNLGFAEVLKLNGPVTRTGLNRMNVYVRNRPERGGSRRR